MTTSSPGRLQTATAVACVISLFVSGLGISLTAQEPASEGATFQALQKAQAVFSANVANLGAPITGLSRRLCKATWQFVGHSRKEWKS